jgi:CheY-like chemotaxis protein/two-component sensor histidine kinase
MQAQLMISDRMATVGTLAAGVAHEINNPLSAVVANLELAAKEAAEMCAKLGGSHELLEELHDAQEAAERIRLIVRDLKIFSRGDEQDAVLVDLHRVLESTLRMAGNEIRHRARIVKEFGAIPLVAASESRLGQVFLNLLMNAAQAIPEGAFDTNEIRLVTSTSSSGFAVVEIRDTGQGIAPEILPRLFTPFFTTKPVGVGTGLGLSICHRIVAGLGGQIQVVTEVGRGATFRVVLPPGAPSTPTSVSQAPPAPAPAKSPSEGPARRGKVLVVDDETAIGSAIRRTLGRDHDVTVLSKAREALDRVAAGERFDVILCDLMMPEVTGMDLHDELARTCPEQLERVIFMTGGAFTPRAQAFLQGMTHRRLDKPFDPKVLRDAVLAMMK